MLMLTLHARLLLSLTCQQPPAGVKKALWLVQLQGTPIITVEGLQGGCVSNLQHKAQVASVCIAIQSRDLLLWWPAHQQHDATSAVGRTT